MRNLWSEAEFADAAQRRPLKFYKDIHGRALRGEIADAEITECLQTLEALLDHMKGLLDPGPWIAAPHLSLAGINVAPFIFRLWAVGVERFWSAGHRPRVNDWYKRIAARSAVQTAVNWPDESGGGYEEVGLGKKLTGDK